MPTSFVWVVLLLGLAVVAGCLIVPREIGREDEPLLDPRLAQDVAARLRQARSRLNRQADRRAAKAPAHEPAADDPAVEPPSAMDVPRPVLAQDPSFTLAANGDQP